MAKKIITQKDKSQSFLSKLTAHFKSTSNAVAEEEEKEETAAEEEEAEPAADDETPEVDDEKKDDETSAADESTDDDDEKDEEDDTMAVNGKAVNLKDTKATRKAIQGLLDRSASQDKLLKEAKTTIEANMVELNKTAEEVSNDIRSDFTPEGSKRSSKARVETALPAFMTPAAGSIAASAVKNTMDKLKK